MTTTLLTGILGALLLILSVVIKIYILLDERMGAD